MKIKPTIGNTPRATHLAWVAAVALLFAACQQEHFAGPEEAPDEGFTLAFHAAPPTRSQAAPGAYTQAATGTRAQTAPGTRSAIALAEGEDQINSLYLLFFEESNNGSGKFLGYHEVPTRDADGNLLDPPLSSKEQVRVKFSDITVLQDPFDGANTFVPDGDYSLLLLANVEEFIGGQDIATWIAALKGKTESAVLNGKLLAITGANDETDNSHAIQPTNLPMNARAKRAANQAAVSVELRRSVFRVSVENRAADYQLTSASLWNVYPETPAWENVMNLFEKPRVQRFYGVTATGNTIDGGLYAFENLETDNAPDDNATTCLLLGFLKDGVTHYYRANINVIAGLGQQLARNGAYRLRINSIKGAGESCEMDAYTSGEFLLDIAVNEWDVDNQGNIQSNGDELLAIPTTSILFTPAAETRAYSIYARGATPLELSRSILPAGISVNLSGNTLTVAVTATSEPRGGYIELRQGTLKAIIDIRQSADSDKYIDLSLYSAPPFPGNGVYQMEGSVRVNSSGPWSAKIHGAGFTFQYRGPELSPSEIFHLAPGERFIITTLGTNASDEPRYAFIVVYLDDDPEINQVFIVTQSGKADFDITPPVSPTERVTFDATGTRTVGRDKYKVVPGANLEWKAAVTNPHFRVHYHDAAGDELPATTTSLTGAGYFSVTSDLNTTSLPVNGSVDVSLVTNPGARQTITLLQEPFTLTLGAVPDIPATGGTRDITLTLLPAWSGATWEATVTTSTSYHKAYFGTPGTYTTTGATGAPVSLTFAKSPAAYPRIIPEATVTVTLAGTSLARTIVVRQAPPVARPLTFQSNARTGYGSLGPGPSNAAYFDAFNYLIRDLASFGPTGHVYTAAAFTFTANGTVNTGTTVYNANVSDISSAERNSVKTWMNANPANFLMMVNDNVNSPGDRTEMLRLLSSSFATEYVGESVRTIAARPSSGAGKQKVWDYIMVNGPFGAVDLGTTFRSDGYIRALSGHPSTTVPLLTGNGRVQVAIDPVLHLLYIGDVDLFGTFAGRNAFPGGSSKGKLVNNIIAFMVNAAQYGEYFLSEFRD